MKKYLLLIVIVTALAACKKTHVVLSPGLIGKWELRRTYGGFSYHDSTYRAGNGNIYQFNSDSTYKRFDNKTLAASGIFHIHKDNGYQPQSLTIIIFDDNIGGDPIAINSDKLTIGTTIADGIAYDYQKIAN
jgi:hypothetical protein